MKFIKNRLIFKLIAVIFIATMLFSAGYWFKSSADSSVPTAKTTQQSRDYYISFEDYYYEVPKQRAVDDKIVVGAQFLYPLGKSIKANSLDDLFNDGAVGVQPLIPLNGLNQAFEDYLNNVSKPAAGSSFGGTAELTFADRDGVKTASLLSKKDGQVVRRQFLVNLPQAVAVVSKDDSETFKTIGQTLGQASAKFADYNRLKLQAVAEGLMVKNQMWQAIYDSAHPDLQAANDVEEFTRLGERSKDLFELEPRISGAKIGRKEMTVSVVFVHKEDSAKNRTVSLTFQQSEGEWKLITLQLPNGAITGKTDEQ